MVWMWLRERREVEEVGDVKFIVLRNIVSDGVSMEIILVFREVDRRVCDVENVEGGVVGVRI